MGKTEQQPGALQELSFAPEELTILERELDNRSRPFAPGTPRHKTLRQRRFVVARHKLDRNGTDPAAGLPLEPPSPAESPSPADTLEEAPTTLSDADQVAPVERPPLAKVSTQPGVASDPAGVSAELEQARQTGRMLDPSDEVQEQEEVPTEPVAHVADQLFKPRDPIEAIVSAEIVVDVDEPVADEPPAPVTPPAAASPEAEDEDTVEMSSEMVQMAIHAALEATAAKSERAGGGRSPGFDVGGPTPVDEEQPLEALSGRAHRWSDLEQGVDQEDAPTELQGEHVQLERRNRISMLLAALGNQEQGRSPTWDQQQQLVPPAEPGGAPAGQTSSGFPRPASPFPPAADLAQPLEDEVTREITLPEAQDTPGSARSQEPLPAVAVDESVASWAREETPAPVEPEDAPTEIMTRAPVFEPVPEPAPEPAPAEVARELPPEELEEVELPPEALEEVPEEEPLAEELPPEALEEVPEEELEEVQPLVDQQQGILTSAPALDSQPAVKAPLATGPYPRLDPPADRAAAARTAPRPVPTQPAVREVEPDKRRRKRSWYLELFDTDWLRTIPDVAPRQVEREVDFIEQSLQPTAGSQILELGVGTGQHSATLGRRGHDLVGCDMSLPLLLNAADQAQRNGLQVSYLKGDFRNLGLEARFDAVYCMFTRFGCFDDESNRGVIKEVNRALKVGGRFLLEIVNRDYAIQNLPARIWWEGEGCVVLEEVSFEYFTSRIINNRTVVFEDGRHLEQEISLRAYSLHEVGKLLHRAGFRVMEVSGHVGHRGEFFGIESRSLVLLAEKRPD